MSSPIKQVRTHLRNKSTLTKCLGLAPSMNELCDYHVGRRNSGEDEEKDKRDLEPVPSFTKVHDAYKTVK